MIKSPCNRNKNRFTGLCFFTFYVRFNQFRDKLFSCFLYGFRLSVDFINSIARQFNMDKNRHIHLGGLHLHTVILTYLTNNFRHDGALFGRFALQFPHYKSGRVIRFIALVFLFSCKKFA